MDNVGIHEWGISLRDGSVCGYQIEWPQIDTKLKLLGWIRHVSEKSWATASMVSEMIDAVCTHWIWSVGI